MFSSLIGKIIRGGSFPAMVQKQAEQTIAPDARMVSAVMNSVNPNRSSYQSQDLAATQEGLAQEEDQQGGMVQGLANQTSNQGIAQQDGMVSMFGSKIPMPNNQQPGNILGAKLNTMMPLGYENSMIYQLMSQRKLGNLFGIFR